MNIMYKCPKSPRNPKSPCLTVLSPNMRRFVEDFFPIVDRYVQQVHLTDQQSHDNLL